ncbi:GIY-YIG nuclease family protein [Ureaplasma canigenitalium]|uniref:hypothetical protein n=1 Tax=Ureaplasma canigenitalium TaxID=42092 RepID=UPI0004E0C2B0|nr:hypothetical protein [Ureaplasma canigenitalium]
MKNKKNLEHLKALCDFTDNIYISKMGKEYVQALNSVFSLVNKNDRPFTIEEILEQPTLLEFSFEGKMDFKYICDLKAKPLMIMDEKRDNEKIIATNFVNQNAIKIFEESLGVAYIITAFIDDTDYIVKFGQTRTTFKLRLNSYNCGVVNNWRTASTTNIKMLQSMVTTRLTFHLYIFDCSDEPYILTWCNETSTPFASPKSLAVEDIMVNKFIEQFKKRPLANIQANATSKN